MRIWNDWGCESSGYSMELSDSLSQMLAALVGPSKGLPAVTLEQVMQQVPASRLEDHPLVTTDVETRVRHARGQSLPDWLAMHSGDIGAFPDGVAFPEDSQQVAELLRYAVEKDVEVIPYGGGTSVAGHINPLASDRPILTLSLAKLNGLIALDEDSQLATFGAGTPGPVIEQQLRERGYTLGHYPQSWELSTVGGWVASRSSGQQSLRYGRIEQMFAGGRVETLQGTLEIPTIPASSAGPDVREIFLGSEGKMGIITEVVVRVTPSAEQESFHVVFLPSWEQGLAAVRTLAQGKVPLSMLRLSNALETKSLLSMSSDAESVSKLMAMLGQQGISDGAVMMTCGATGTEAQCQFALEQMRQICREQGGVEAPEALGQSWEHGRFRAPYLRAPLGAGGYVADTMETAVNWNNVTETVDRLEESIRNALADEEERVHVYTHLSHVYGQGSSVYSTYLFRFADSYEETLQRWHKLKAAGAEQIVACGGTISHQHGVGYDHKFYLEAEKTPLGIGAIRNLCDYFDPQGRLNPGKLLPDAGEG